MSDWIPGEAQKEGVVTLAVLDYLVAAIQEGDTRALTEMGVSATEVPWLLDMCQWDRQLWLRNALMPLRVTVDIERLNRIRERMRQQRASYEVVVAMARGDAPIEMMQVMCGIGRKAYRHLRVVLGLPSLRLGRHKQVGVELELELDKRIDELGGGAAIEAADCLALQEETGANLRDIWARLAVQLNGAEAGW